jgi:transposase InsO family protein
MPWKEVSTMSLREEFVLLADQEGANIRHLCRSFAISPKTAYKWLNRYNHQGTQGLADHSRRPASSPIKTDNQIEELVVQERQAHPAWGGRKLHHILCARYPHLHIPHPNTITDILRRHNCLQGPLTPPHNSHQQWHRFEHPTPNSLWQMDFKGHFCTTQGVRCHPLTLLDDHSRFSLAVKACANEQSETVQSHLTHIFRLYGLPARITMDNGSPWGDTLGSPYTPLTVWLLHLGVGISHSRPYHPQTQGKDERFHRTLKAEVLYKRVFNDLQECQRRFDEWRDEYNLHRPHEALGMQVPASRYRTSERTYPEELASIEYPAVGTQGVVAVRKVQDKGIVQYKGREWHVSKAFKGYAVMLKQTKTEGVLDIYFSQCQHPIAQIDLRSVRTIQTADLQSRSDQPV